MVKAYCNNVLWEVYIGVSGQGDASIGPSPLLKINKSPIDQNQYVPTRDGVNKAIDDINMIFQKAAIKAVLIKQKQKPAKH